MNENFDPIVKIHITTFRVTNPSFNRPSMSQNKFYTITNTGINNNNNTISNYTKYCECTSNSDDASLNCPLGLLQDPSNTVTYTKRQM